MAQFYYFQNPENGWPMYLTLGDDNRPRVGPCEDEREADPEEKGAARVASSTADEMTLSLRQLRIIDLDLAARHLSNCWGCKDILF